MTENDNQNNLEKLSLSDKIESNIPLNILLNISIGSKIKLLNSNTEYIFYGYNHNQTLISCFPINSSNAVDNMIYVLTEQVQSVIP